MEPKVIATLMGDQLIEVGVIVDPDHLACQVHEPHRSPRDGARIVGSMSWGVPRRKVRRQQTSNLSGESWRTRHDSNVWPSPSEGDALSS